MVSALQGLFGSDCQGPIEGVMLHPGHFLRHIMYGVIYSLEALTLVEMLSMELFSHGNSSLALHGRVWVLLALYGGQRLQTVQVLLMEMKTGTFVV